ncbi:protein TonB [Bacterioplanes sanyensis]|uniref:energy transducer TonB n=1 Tax=Bacterioplanes sanyensis TaxID=1249553 RepID=UPI00167A9501|nr:energy transducer TonB [Bacterioplanes sanyensis]GGY41993.1 protein TonB [Bacterioplanes sanyensis]
MRLLLASGLATAVTLVLFYAMHAMVLGPAELQQSAKEQAVVDFVRLKENSETQLKERRRKEPPKPQQPTLPDTAVAQQSTQVQSLQIDFPDVAADLSVSNQSFLGDAVVGMGMGDSEVLPLVKVQPQYPRRALRARQEGYVTARLSITPEGTVDDVEVIDSKPPGVFEREAVMALYRYKFKPKMVDNKPVAQTATQTIEFKLGDN